MNHATPITKSIIAYILLYPLVFFSARGSFSFETQSTNNQVMAGATLIAGSSAWGRLQLETVIAYGIVLLAMAPVFRSVVLLAMRNKALLALPFLAILSSVWSQEPVKSALYGSFALVLTLFSFYLVQRFPAEQQLQLLVRVGAVAAVLSCVLALWAPSVGVDHKTTLAAWQGIFPHKNVCGIVMCFMLTPVLYWKTGGLARKCGRLAYILLALALIVLSQSRTAWILAGLSLLFAGALRIMLRLRFRESLIILSLVLGLIIGGVSAARYVAPSVLQFLGKDMTLTGRTQIWAACLQSIAKAPMLGYGYDAFWLASLKGESGKVAMATGFLGIGYAENGILELWLELGLLGVTVLLVSLGKACVNVRHCLTRGSPPHVRWYISVLFLTILGILDGDKFMFPHMIEWVLYTVAYAGLSVEAATIRCTTVKSANPDAIEYAGYDAKAASIEDHVLEGN